VLTHALAKPAPGYLFCGPRGVGKGTITEQFIAGLLSGAVQTHPDFMRVVREEGAREIVVKQARELIGRMQLTSACGGYKVALIEEADRLNEEAANALLKAVEEPSKNTVYVFLAEQPDRLPATLRSRLTKIEFGRVPIKQIADWLATLPLTPMVNTQKIAEQSRGCPGIAWRLACGEETAWDQEIDWVKTLDALLSPPIGKQLAVIEYLTKTIESQQDPESAWHVGLDRLMCGLHAHFGVHPFVAAQLGHGLVHAWKLVGGAISPRLAIEYALIPDHAKQGRMIPRILYPLRPSSDVGQRE